MTHSFKLSRRIARLRAPVFASMMLAVFACNDTDSVSPGSSIPPETIDQGSEAGSQMAPAGTPALATSRFAGGIPIGTFAQPTTEFGDRYNGGMRNIWPSYLLRELQRIKERGGKVVLMFAGNEDHYKDGAGHFDLGKWKARVDRFKNLDFSSYVEDGTIIGHYLIDEPYDPFNWHGRPVSGAVVEEMARYSKQLWPNMPTIVRSEPYFLGNGSFRYLDAAWAQYTSQKGDVGDYISRNVSEAQRRGLALVVGLNITKGSPNKSRMSAGQIESTGSELLRSSYPCAFISWTYNSDHLSSGSVKDAMDALRRKAENRNAKSCRGS
jgi:hypothetical protein